MAASVNPTTWNGPVLIDDELEVENASSLAISSIGAHYFVRDSGPAPAYTGEIIYYAAQESPEPPATAIITPEGGGTLQSDSGDVQAVFPPGAVTENVAVTYSKAAPLGTRRAVGFQYFNLTAETVTEGTPVTHFEKDYVLTVSYAGSQPADENSLGLYYWDGGQWILVEGSLLDQTQQTVSASLDHMTLFALFSDSLEVFLPIILR
jgi:hypothetical protein